jgi:AbrB family transcriptional regulator (stage V sporulation protein T)
MKATGIVRRIDDLGRVVVPKEIRRTLRIREGEPMEIFTGREGEIVLKKYSPIGEMSKYAVELAESMAQTTGHLVLISDHDQIVAACGQEQKDFLGKGISRELEMIIAARELKEVDGSEKNAVRIIESGEPLEFPMIILPIISAGDAIGAVILISKSSVGDSDVKLAQVASGFLGKQMEG